jgi:hypothetical protein|nr:MAG TPA: hypothetical protein [Caudoviricetes sp.]
MILEEPQFLFMSNTDVSAKEFGALQANVEHIKDVIDKHTIMLERMEVVLSGNVSRIELEQYKKEHQQEIKEKYLQRSEIESLLSFWRLITSNLAKLFAVALVGLAIYVTGNLVRQSETVTSLKEDIQRINVRHQ